MWLKKQVSLYTSHSDNTGRPATYRDILHSDSVNDINTIIALRKLDRTDLAYKEKKAELKSKLQCYTPAALLASKAKGKLSEIHRTGIMQLDFDYEDIKEYDIQELKQAIFDLPFIGFCGLSCSGDGFYALALIAEPERLSDYAEHCFDVLLKYGIKADTSKGKKVENLRYVSYDSKMLLRENPEPLYLRHLKPKQAIKYTNSINNTQQNYKAGNGLTNEGLNMLQNATIGNRFPTVQRIAYTLGGTKNKTLLDKIKEIIKNGQQYKGEEIKYLKCAEDCFNAGLQNPFK